MNTKHIFSSSSLLPQPVPAAEAVAQFVEDLPVRGLKLFRGGPASNQSRSGNRFWRSAAVGAGVIAAAAAVFISGAATAGGLFRPTPIPVKVNDPAGAGSVVDVSGQVLAPKPPRLSPDPDENGAAAGAVTGSGAAAESDESAQDAQPALAEKLSSQKIKFWTPPVAGATAQDVLRAFDNPEKPWQPGHRGIDLRIDPSQPVLAPAAGRIVVVQKVVDRHVVTIRHDDGTLSSFEPVISHLKVGDYVAAGDPIGRIEEGSTHCGPDMPPCVHWGVRKEDALRFGSSLRDEYQNPAIYLGWVTPSVLWPKDHNPPGF